MVYSTLGWLHAYAVTLWERARDQRGQGTVEYVGVVVLVTLLVGAVAAAAKGWAGPIGNELREALTKAIERVAEGFR